MHLKDLRAHREAAGWSVTELARRSNTSDRVIQILEDGGETDHWVCERITNALADAPSAPSASAVLPAAGKKRKSP